MMQADHLPSRPGPIRTWVLAARIPTLPAAVVPVLVGSATAWSAGLFQPLPFVAALVIGMSDTACRYFLPEAGAIFIFLFVFAVLIWRPNGIMERR